ncbi:hypothetical protein KM043_004272 [Ampulex compressa]|nr:hypothetical protein KM043_004272 [Ampulex compressa]
MLVGCQRTLVVLQKLDPRSSTSRGTRKNLESLSSVDPKARDVGDPKLRMESYRALLPAPPLAPSLRLSFSRELGKSPAAPVILEGGHFYPPLRRWRSEGCRGTRRGAVEIANGDVKGFLAKLLCARGRIFSSPSIIRTRG